MKRTWSPDELAAHWVLTDTERQLLPDRVDPNRLGFAVHLKFFELEGRFPESPREMRRHPAPVRYTFLAAFGWQRRRDIIDGLVDLLMLVIHRIGMRAERKVVQELLRDLQLYRRFVPTSLRRSYSHHYRRMLPLILEALTFRSNNAAHRPVIDALARLNTHRDSRKQFVSCLEIPMDGVVRPQLQELLIETGPDGVDRINRINDEICILQALRKQIRCKEI